MRKSWCLLVVVGLVAQAWVRADDKVPPAGDPAKPDPGKAEPAKDVDKRDVRTRLPIAVIGLTEKNADQLVEKLVELGAIEEALVDQKTKAITVVLASEASCTLTEISKALQKGKADIDPKRLTLKHPCTIVLKGPLDGTHIKDERDKFKSHPGRAFALMPGQKLLDDLKAIEGVRSASFPDDTSIKLGMDREVSFARIAEHIADRGSRDAGSAYIADVQWKGDKQPPARGEGRGHKGRDKGHGSEGSDPSAPPKEDSGLR